MKRLALALAAILAGCASENAAAPREASSLDGSAVASETSEARTTFDPATPLTVEDCARIALASSLTARSFEARLKAAHGAAEAAAAWPNPVFEYNVEDVGTVLNRERQLLQQMIVHYPVFAWWTKGLEADVAHAEEARTEAQVEDDRRLLRLEVARAFYELLADDESLKNESEAVEIAARLADAASKRRTLGDASALDEKRARAEELEARRDLEKARRQRAVDGIAFVLALGAERPVAVQLAPGWPDALPAGIADDGTAALVERALASRPDVHEAEAAALKAAKAASLEDRRAIPLAEWQLAGGASKGPEGYGAIVNAQGPLPVFDWNGGNRTRARGELESALADLEKTKRQVAFEVEAALVAWSRSREALAAFGRPIADARQANLDATRRLFLAGELSYVDLLQAQRDSVAARRDLVESEKDAALARARLVIALGR